MLPRRIWLPLLLPFALLVIGTLGYRAIEGPKWSLFDSLYMTVITLTTVGYGETHRLSVAGRAFTIFLLLSGVFTFFYAATEVIRFIVSGEMQAALGRQLMERNLAEMRQHLIVCGYGRMGQLVCQEFTQQKTPFVLIDRNEEALKDFRSPVGVTLVGDATSDEVLLKAGVERARALVTVAASDADNLYITMSARLLNETLFIVARAEDEHAERKLTRAGANRVVSPYVIGGARVAQAVLRPTVVDFIELATRTAHMELQIEETLIGERSLLVGTTLRDSQLRQALGIILVAIKKKTGDMIFNPAPEAVLDAGDILISLGNRQGLDQLETLAVGSRR